MTPEEEKAIAHKIAMKTIDELTKQLGFGRNRMDALFMPIRVGKLSMHLAVGDPISMSKLMIEMMEEHDQFRELFTATLLAFMQFSGTSDQRSYIIKSLLDMEVENMDKGDGKGPKVKVLGFENMPDSLKEKIGEALGEEFKGFMKPSKEDVKPSQN